MLKRMPFLMLVLGFVGQHRTVVFSAPNFTGGHHPPMPLPGTPGHSQASLTESLVRTLLLSSGSWCAQSFVCVLQESVPQFCCNSAIKSHWPPTSNSLGVLSPFSGSPGWEICCGS